MVADSLPIGRCQPKTKNRKLGQRVLCFFVDGGGSVEFVCGVEPGRGADSKGVSFCSVVVVVVVVVVWFELFVGFSEVRRSVCFALG